MGKKISLLLTAQCLEREDTVNPTVVIYDILRATSTITTALAHGAKAIIPVLEPEDAFKLHAVLRKECSILLGGERNGEAIPGFHLGNSPVDYTREKVHNQTIIFTTTNGTRAMINSQKAGAKKILIASLLNQEAIVRSLRQESAITIVCAGVKGRFAFEDFFAAGLMLHELLILDQDLSLDDCALAALGLARGFKCNPEMISFSFHGCRLLAKEKTVDVHFCSAANRFPIIPIFDRGRIELSSAPLPINN